jgi:hypothetical protein
MWIDTDMNAIFTRTTSVAYLLIITLLVLAWGDVVQADSLKMKVGEKQCVVGEKLYFAISISLEEEKTIDVSDVTYNGAPLRYEVRNQSTSSFTMIVNGKTVRQSSDLIKSYIFELPTTAVGPISLPVYTIKVGESEYTTKPLHFEVLPKPTSHNLLFITELVDKRDAYYPTQIIEVSCKIYIRQFPGSPRIESIRLPILDHRAFELIPPRSPNVKLLVNGAEFLVEAEKGSETRDGKAFNVFGFKLKFRLMETGDYQFDNSIKMLVETGRNVREKGFFGYQLVREKQTIYAASPVLAIRVAELPRDNVPPSFNGAIGVFKIEVIPSSDTDIKVGDPITLTIEINGRGTWEFVKSPPIHKIREITDYFKISDEPAAGEVSEDGTRKTFRVRMRVKSKTVKEIPAIPFTYFDLLTMQYVTVYSEPIPISVFDATSKVQVVDFTGTPGSESPDKDEEMPSGAMVDGDKAVPMISEAVYTPKLPELVPISDNVGGPELAENHAPNYSLLIFAACPLGVVLVMFLVRVYRERNKSASVIAREKSKDAYGHFLKKCAPLEKKGVHLNDFYRDLGRNIHTFLEEKLMCSISAPDRAFFEKIAEDGKTDGTTAETLLALIERIDLHRYSKTAGDRQEAAGLLKEAKKVLEQW